MGNMSFQRNVDLQKIDGLAVLGMENRLLPMEKSTKIGLIPGFLNSA